MLVDAHANFFLGVLGETPELARAIDAKRLFHVERFHALAAADQATAAARRAEANALSLEHDHTHAHLGKIQRSGQAGEACADHAHVRDERFVEFGAVGDAVSGCYVVTVRVARTIGCCHVFL